MFKEIDVIELLNACATAQATANKTGVTQEVKINDYEVKKEGCKQ
jgi:hypothetical protein